MILDLFSLKGKTAIVTGSEGLLGKMHMQVIRELGGKAIGIDIQKDATYYLDITNPFRVASFAKEIGPVDILINNAAARQNGKDDWDNGLAVGLSGAWYMSRAFGPMMKKGVILNIGSDLSLIAPDQRLYKTPKPASYSVSKHGIVGLTKYMATLWSNVRSNCLCPGGVEQNDGIDPTHLIPLGRRARLEELRGPVAFLISDASSYMTGAVISVDGGRTSW